ncbi:MAG TPA: ATP-binding protein [Anaerolineales bacterium]|nr:ATP-binding protein [Anaerolineales bacterium]
MLSRLFIGNSLVIILGAIGGTLVTSRVASMNIEADTWLILLFASIGVGLSLVVNFWLTRATLRPLHDLVSDVDHIQDGQATTRVRAPAGSDPDAGRLAEAINSMLDRLERRTLELRALTERVISAQEEERKRIARGMHDDTGQAISTLIIGLERMAGMVPPEAPELAKRIAATREIATRTLEDLRTVVYGLRPTMLDDLGLAPAIRWYARSQFEEAGTQLVLDLPDGLARATPEVETTVFRIAQEAVNNVKRHAGAQRVAIALRVEAGWLELRVQDDGRGFDVQRTSQEALRLRRFGLMGMKERVDLVGGSLQVESQPGRGTQLVARIPAEARVET